MLILAILCIILAAIMFIFSAYRQRKSGMPGGRIIYTDTRTWGTVEKPLYDASIGLTGRPDYLVDNGSSLIPVEVKSTRIPENPYDSHIFQLAAYCLLVERVLHKRPPYGIIHYADRSGGSRSFAIDYTHQLETTVLDLLSEIRALERSKDVPRSHDVAARCTRCGYKSICEEKLCL